MNIKPGRMAAQLGRGQEFGGVFDSLKRLFGRTIPAAEQTPRSAKELSPLDAAVRKATGSNPEEHDSGVQELLQLLTTLQPDRTKATIRDALIIAAGDGTMTQHWLTAISCRIMT